MLSDAGKAAARTAMERMIIEVVRNLLVGSQENEALSADRAAGLPSMPVRSPITDKLQGMSGKARQRIWRLL